MMKMRDLCQVIDNKWILPISAKMEWIVCPGKCLIVIWIIAIGSVDLMGMNLKIELAIKAEIKRAYQNNQGCQFKQLSKKMEQIIT